MTPYHDYQQRRIDDVLAYYRQTITQQQVNAWLAVDGVLILANLGTIAYLMRWIL